VEGSGRGWGAGRSRGPLPGEAAAGGPAHRDGDRADRPGTPALGRALSGHSGARYPADV